ncbi:hypothetical protein ABPG74_001916, partial [Tetrahymena malaccensis]
MLTQQQVKCVNSISKKHTKGYPISKIEFDTFILKIQKQNPFTEIQDYFNDQIQQLSLKTRTAKEKSDVTIKQLDCIYEQLKDSIDVMKKEYELLICQKLLVKINQQNPYIQNLDYSLYGAQSQILKAETSQENRQTTSIQPNCSSEGVKHSIDSLLKGYEIVNQYLAKVWSYLYLSEGYEDKKIATFNSAQFIRANSEFDYKMDQYIYKLYVVYNEVNKLQLNKLRDKYDQLIRDSDNSSKQIQIQCELLFFTLKNGSNRKRAIYLNDSDYINCIKMKLLGGSEKQKKQDQKLNDHTCNQNLYEDKSQIQEIVNRGIKINSLNEINEQMQHQVNSFNMIIEEQNGQSINKKNICQKINCNQNGDKSQNKLAVECAIKNKYLNEGNEQAQYQKNHNRISEEQNKEIINTKQKYKQAQCNQNEKKYSDNIQIEEQNSSFYQQLCTQIQYIIKLFNSKKVEKKGIQIEVNNSISQIDQQIKNYEFKEPQKKFIQNQNQDYNQIDKIQIEDLITIIDNSQQKLETQDLSFLKSIFQLGDYLTSGGEADIFVNTDQQVALRVIKINEQETLNAILSELLIIKQFQQNQSILDLQTSHLVENKFNNKQKYIIHAMQICQASLAREYLKISEYSLGQILNITFTCLHFLIQLRQNYIYHSDIKLANILKINDQYKLSDFGASTQININNPFTIVDKYTPYYTPKMNKNLPFYHDIYSVAKTIEVLLNKLNKHEVIKNELEKQLKELLKDDENSIKIDCFQLPQKFIDCLINQIDLETKEFLEIYLVKIEEYLIIKKDNKVFQYESQFQYAQIALKILKIENLNENIKKNQIKLKALQTKSYILIKKGKYQEAFECIQEILNNKLYEQKYQDILISLITTLTKILIKNQQISFSSNVYKNLVEFIENNDECEQLLELKLKLFEIQLNNQIEFQPIQDNFYELLKKIDKNKRLEIIYKLIIKYVKYFELQNTYDDSLDEIIKFIKEDQDNNTSYYKQKLVKKMCIYLDQFFFKKERLNIDFYLKYENQIQNLIQITFNYLLSKKDEQLEICFDKDIQDVFLILLNLKQNGFFSNQKQIEEIEKLIQKYKGLLDITITQKHLPYQEQQYYHYLKFIFRLKQEQSIKLAHNKYDYLIPSADFFNVGQYQNQEVNKQMQKILEVLNSTKINLSQKFQSNQIKYFDSNKFSLNFIGNQQYFEQKFDTFSSHISGKGILNYYLNGQKKDIHLTLNLDSQSDDISYSIKELKEQNQISFEIKF